MKRTNFITVDNSVVDDTRLSPDDKAVYMALCRFADISSNQCWPSVSTLTRIAGRSRTTINKCLKKLRDLGYILLENKSRPDGGKSSNLYTILTPHSNEIVMPHSNEIVMPHSNDLAINNNNTFNNNNTLNNNKDINIVDYVNENTEEDFEMQRRLINIPLADKDPKTLPPQTRSAQKMYAAMASNDWSNITATDYLYWMVGQTGLWDGPAERTILPPIGKDLNYAVRNFKNTFLEPYSLSGPKALEAIGRFVQNYPHACDQKYKDRIDPIIFTMPGVVDRIMKYEDKFKPTKRDVSDEVF